MHVCVFVCAYMFSVGRLPTLPSTCRGMYCSMISSKVSMRECMCYRALNSDFEVLWEGRNCVLWLCLGYGHTYVDLVLVMYTFEHYISS